MAPRFQQLAPDVERRCRCGARLARDNHDELCSPCDNTQRESALEWSIRMAEDKRRRQLEAYRKRATLKLNDIPLMGEYDKAGPDVVQQAVFHYAVSGDFDIVADQIGVQRGEAIRILKRTAAQQTIDFMVEEGTWPEGIPLARI